MYLQFEDDRTKIWIVVGITKLHQSLGFADCYYADRSISDFLDSKDVEIQQRCIEYKQIRMQAERFNKEISLKTPLTPDMVEE